MPPVRARDHTLRRVGVTTANFAQAVEPAVPIAALGWVAFLTTALLRQQIRKLGLPYHADKEAMRNIIARQPVPVPGEGRGIPLPVIYRETGGPTKQKLAIELLDLSSFAATSESSISKCV